MLGIRFHTGEIYESDCINNFTTAVPIRKVGSMSFSSGHTRIQLLVHVHVYDSDSYKAIAPDINSLNAVQ